MRLNKRLAIGIPAFCFILMLIFDTKTAIGGAEKGIDLCIHSVIPSLFPFIFLTGFVTSCFSGCALPFLSLLSNRLGIPIGAESLYLISILGGYPTGAKIVYQAYSENKITKRTAKRLLGFYNNAGPAFIFGIVSKLFTNWGTTWVLWVIHILSSLITAMILPGKTIENYGQANTNTQTISLAIQSSVQTMSIVCGWVIIFRILNTYLHKYLLRFLPPATAAIVYGILELVNGCDAISNVKNEGVRFVIVSGMLAFGGVCVWLQTISVAKNLGTGMYIQGKLFHTIFSILLATIYVLCGSSFICIGIIFVCFITFIFANNVSNREQKTVAKHQQMMYNVPIRNRQGDVQ